MKRSRPPRRQTTATHSRSKRASPGSRAAVGPRAPARPLARAEKSADASPAPGESALATTSSPSAARVRAAEPKDLAVLRSELAEAAAASPSRWNADPEDVRRSVAKLVLTLVEFIRQLLERQAIRRMENGTLSSEQTEEVGQALMRLEETVVDLARQFGLDPQDLNLDLGPLGKLI